MKFITRSLICLVLLYATTLSAQDKHFITSGIIEYERTMNMFALVKRKVTKNTLDSKPWYEQYLRTQPQFRTLKSVLKFSANSTLFTPEHADKVYYQYDTPLSNQLNTVFSDFSIQRSTIQKDFEERTYLVTDSLRKIKWKITDDTRIIAGYNCRRANGIMMDSIYVVAFYSNEIHISGGPESFNGLPGMILGVAVPHENVTWFATKVMETTPSILLSAPKKGKPVNNKQLFAEITKLLAGYGDYAIVALKGLLL
ncbi:MAG: GLPGLI family protein [Phormidesmis sp. FL-bin-119]|nr:GLPGLI family protein [Pedobacter sp.]